MTEFREDGYNDSMMIYLLGTSSSLCHRSIHPPRTGSLSFPFLQPSKYHLSLRQRSASFDRFKPLKIASRIYLPPSLRLISTTTVSNMSYPSHIQAITF